MTRITSWSLCPSHSRCTVPKEERESHIIINCDKPTDKYINNIAEEIFIAVKKLYVIIGWEIFIELEEAVGREVIDLTESNNVQAALREEAEDHVEVIVTTEFLK